MDKVVPRNAPACRAGLGTKEANRQLKEAFEHFQEKYSYAHLRMVKNHCNNTQKEE